MLHSSEKDSLFRCSRTFIITGQNNLKNVIFPKLGEAAKIFYTARWQRQLTFCFPQAILAASHYRSEGGAPFSRYEMRCILKISLIRIPGPCPAGTCLILGRLPYGGEHPTRVDNQGWEDLALTWRRPRRLGRLDCCGDGDSTGASQHR